MHTANAIVEWAPIELADGVDESTLLAASDVFQTDFVSHQHGFIRRELLKAKDGLWIDLIFWNTKADAEQVIKNAQDSPACHAFFSLMKQTDPNDAGAGILHFEHMKSYALD